MGVSPSVHAGALATSNQIQNQVQTQAQISSSSAAGGQGGTAYSTGNSQTMNVGTSHLRNNPNIGLGLMVPTAPCRDTYSIGGSAAGIGGGAAWSKADRECRWQDIGAAFIRAGFIEDGLAMWCAIEGVEDIRRAFMPRGLSRSRIKMGLARRECLTQRRLIHPGHHQNVPGLGVLHDGREKSFRVPFQGREKW